VGEKEGNGDEVFEKEMKRGVESSNKLFLIFKNSSMLTNVHDFEMK